MIWTGTISFGLVNIPIKMYTAVRDHTIRFHRMSEDGTCRLHTKLYCPETGKEYDFRQAARGYEVAPDQYVLVSDEELEALRPESGRAIEIEDFVSLHEIDPIYFERPYYLAPDERGVRSYALLVEAMRRSERVGIARFVLRDKQHLAALRVSQDGLCLSTMRWNDEVVPLSDVAKLPAEKADERQVALALDLIDALSRPFEPEKYRDTFRDEVIELLERKARGERIPVREAPVERAEVVDLMEALKRSLGAVGGEERKPAAAARSSSAAPSKAKAAKKPAKKAAASGSRAKRAAAKTSAARKPAARKPAARKKAASR